MKLNKRIVASAALSESLIAPAVALVAGAADGRATFQNCETGTVDRSELRNAGGFAVVEYLQKHCGMPPGEI